MMDPIGLKSFSFEFEYSFSAAAGNNINIENIFTIPGNGLTVISPLSRNVLIKKVDAFATLERRSTTGAASAAGLVNALNVEFNIVDFAGQIIQLGFPFLNLFVPETGVSVGAINPFYLNLTHTQSYLDICVSGGGVYISKIGFNAQATVTADPKVFRLIFTVFYQD